MTGIKHVSETKRLPRQVKEHLKRICDNVEWERHKGYFIVSNPGRRIGILNETGEQIYDVDTWEDAKHSIDEWQK
jgi:hypothetical protein